MGVWGGVDPVPVDIPRIAGIMRPALYQWFNGQLQFYDPKSSTATPYNAATDTGGTITGSVLWDTGTAGALIMPLKAARRSVLGAEANALVAIQFQTIRTDILLRGGLLVKVVSGGEDPTLPNYTFQLEENINSSYEWGAIMEAVVMTGGVKA